MEAGTGAWENAGTSQGHGEDSWDKSVPASAFKADAGRKPGRNGRGEVGEEQFPGRKTGINRAKSRENPGTTSLSRLPSQVFPAGKLAHGGRKKLGQNGDKKFLPAFVPSIPVR